MRIGKFDSDRFNLIEYPCNSEQFIHNIKQICNDQQWLLEDFPSNEWFEKFSGGEVISRTDESFSCEILIKNFTSIPGLTFSYARDFDVEKNKVICCDISFKSNGTEIICDLIPFREAFSENLKQVPSSYILSGNSPPLLNSNSFATYEGITKLDFFERTVDITSDQQGKISLIFIRYCY